ncbi:glycosyltransferase family 2 protein [Rhodanobacter ginsengiterrae]|uniref:glycosyltransferase family 2 protein n=1 Tax=Rhodanobacter ginsengiterrae TaxID=2008451 RepID=UPI003CF48755
MMAPAAKLPFLGTLRVHSVLYGNEANRIDQAIEHLERAADFAIAAGVFKEVALVYGDCSPTPALSETVKAHARSGSALHEVDYRYFDENLGSARGHNRLLEDLAEDYVLIMNPDIMMAPNTLLELAKPFANTKVGMVEAKQIPIEHPKEYVAGTGETCWAATACTLIPAQVFAEIGGFDYQTFFLYCDDVDFSWRVRLAGLKVIYQASALAFHDKRLGGQGKWVPGGAEKYYSAEAALLLAYKYHRDDIVRDVLKYFLGSGEETLLAAAAEFQARREEGRLPEQIDPSHKVAVFKDGAYSAHRFVL